MFNFMANLLGADPGLMHTLATLKVVIICVIGVLALAIIVLVLCQKGNSGGSSAITGVQETYYSHNKGGTVEGRLKKWTIIISIVIAVLVIAYFVLNHFVGDA